MSNDEILTIKETAALLKTTRQQVRKMIANEELPAVESWQGVASVESWDYGVFRDESVNFVNLQFRCNQSRYCT